jgi:hypothetical protein
MADAGMWAPVVYGRTLRRDHWWRAMPRGVDRRWLESVVMPVVAGGRGIDRARFLLVRGPGEVCVGVACRARELNADMHRDAAGRELYGFVGWVAPASAAASAPLLADLRASYAQWAGAVYQDCMKDWWEQPEYERTGPQATQPGPVQWPATQPVRRTSLDRQSWAWPAAEGGKVWELVRAARRPAAVSVGWATAAEAQPEHLDGPFHVVADDVDERRVLSFRPPPPPPPVPPPPQAETGKDIAVPSGARHQRNRLKWLVDRLPEPLRQWLFPRTSTTPPPAPQALPAPTRFDPPASIHADPAAAVRADPAAAVRADPAAAVRADPAAAVRADPGTLARPETAPATPKQPRTERRTARTNADFTFGPARPAAPRHPDQEGRGETEG